MNKIRLLYVATGDFGVPILEKLAADEAFEVIGVVTAPDKPQGRKLVLTPTEVKKTAQRLSIPVMHPTTKEELFTVFQNAQPDIALIVAYGMIFPEKILKLPKYGCINVHGSVLPKYRGASPIHQALLNGDTKTGNTWTIMEKKMDAGPIIATSRCEIGEKETFLGLYKKLAHDAAQHTPSYLLNYIKIGQSTPQSDKNATYCSIIDKEHAEVSFLHESARQIFNKFRAYHEWPQAYFKTKNLNIKIIQCSIVEQNSDTYKLIEEMSRTYHCKPGARINESDKKLIFKTKEGYIELEQVQPPSKKPMSGISFFNGYRNELE